MHTRRHFPKKNANFANFPGFKIQDSRFWGNFLNPGLILNEVILCLEGKLQFMNECDLFQAWKGTLQFKTDCFLQEMMCFLT
jgi:hypothetical protein